jgi:hypothetical protein
MFDPETGRLLDREALRSLQVNPKGLTVPRPVIRDGKKVTPVLDPATGRFEGTSVEHGSGRVDQHVLAQAARASTSQGA